MSLAVRTLAVALFVVSGARGADRVTVASKKFTESVVLAEVLAHLAEDAGAEVTHLRELGGTRLVFDALVAGDVDAYVEYSGTLREEILGGSARTEEAVRDALARRKLLRTEPLGFDNTYVLGMRAERAADLGVRAISDLRAHPELDFGLTNEFLDRADGWRALRERYRLPQRARGLDHDLAYRSLAAGSIDVTDFYATDPEIDFYGLVRLADDLEHFPDYEAFVLYRADLAKRAPGVVASFRRLEGALDERTVAALNREAKIDRVPDSRVAARFLRERFGIESRSREESLAARLVRHTREHAVLVAVSLLASMIAAIPLGILAAKSRRAAPWILGAVGVVQTVPALALLVLMIPLLGIGGPSAVTAMFLYSLLPIVRNTASGIRELPPAARESAEALGLPWLARLRLVELPMASPMILAGIKTSAVINVGTATLGALVGAGGYGQLILTGIRLADDGLLLLGAVPAALFALAMQGLFDLLERFVVPAGLRVGSGDAPA